MADHSRLLTYITGCREATALKELIRKAKARGAPEIEAEL